MIPSEIKLLDLLSNQKVTFFIPPYQRNYEWTNEQCSVFFDDIVKTAKSNINGDISEHFFGSVTHFKTETAFGKPDKLILVDGQQRITTTMLFLASLRDSIKDEMLKETITNDYLKNEKETGESEYKIKLKQVEKDWNVYRKIILQETCESADYDSPIYKNYIFFITKLKQLDNIKTEDLVTYGLSKFSVITIQLEPLRNKWENPQEIFESMNSLGKPLSLADLVRNYLLLGLDSDKQEEYYNKYWLKIENAFPINDKVSNVSYYIRDYMQMKKAVPFKKATEKNHKELYFNFKNIFGDKNAEELLKELSEDVSLYASIAYGKTTNNKKIDRALTDLRRLNTSTMYSVLILILKEWKNHKIYDNELVDILDVCKNYYLRRRICGLTGGENLRMPVLAKRIPELLSVSNKKEKMFEILATQENNTRFPNDIEVRNVLENINFYNFGYCKFVLSLIEEKITKTFPSQDSDVITIEHIMPRTLDKEGYWAKELGENYEEIHTNLINNIGNLTLLTYNQEASNKPFNDKKQIYNDKTGLQIARTEIVNKEKWNEESIKNRCNWIITFILEQLIPLPEKMKKANNYNIVKVGNLSFNTLGIIDCEIVFKKDSNIKAKVINDKEVEFEGKNYLLSTLTREIYTRRGETSPSGSYRGADHWLYEGILLSDWI